jgi:superfamily II DNA or RNA helicase
MPFGGAKVGKTSKTSCCDMMTLWDFEKTVSKAVMQRALALANVRSISDLQELAPGSWYALVAGSSGNNYEVTVNFDTDTQDIQEYECDCPYDLGGPCKHTVAVFLAIRRRLDPKLARRTSANARAEHMEKMSELLAKAHALRAASKGNAPETAASSAGSGQSAQGVAALMGRFEALSREEQHAVRLACLIWENFSPTRFMEIFNQTGLRWNGRGLDNTSIKSLMGQLLDQGFLLREEGYIRCTRDLAQVLYAEPLKADDMMTKIWIDVIRRFLPLYSYSWSNNADLLSRYMRELRLDCLLSNTKDFEQHYQSLRTYPRNKMSRAAQLAQWLPEEPDLAVLNRLPKGILAFLLREQLSMTLMDLMPIGPYLYFTEENIHDFPAEDVQQLLVLLAQIHLLRGDWAGFDRILLKVKDEASLCFLQAMRLVQVGKATAAIESFNLGLKALRKQTRNSKQVTPGFPGLFHVVALFQARDYALYASIGMMLERSLKQDGPFSPAQTCLKAVAQHLQNQDAEAMRTLGHPVNQSTPFSQFFHTLASYWVKPEALSRPELERQRATLAQNGYAWMANEVAVMLAATALDGQAAADAETARLGVVPLAHALPRVEAWETGLNALLGIGSNAPQAKTVENETRLVWLVHLDRHMVQPKEQIFGKNGWSVGRNVAIDRLQSGAVPGMTEQDKRIARQISNYWSSNWDKMLQEMVGHPLLFLWNSPEVGFQLLREQPKLQVRPAEGGYQLSFSHKFDAPGVYVEKESPTRYKLVVVNEKQIEVLRALKGKPLFVPEQAKDKLQQAISGLAHVVEAESAIEDENLPELPADSRPCVHLLPVGNGFHLEFFAKPFAVAPPYFRPGEGEALVSGIVDGQRSRSRRDLKAEKKRLKETLAALETLGQAKQGDGIWDITDADACLALLAELHPLLEAGKVMLEWPKGEKFRVQKMVGLDELRVKVGEGRGWFEVSGGISVDEDKVLTMRDLIQLSEQAKGPFVELSPGKFLALTKAFQKHLQQINGLMTPQKDGSMQLHPLAALAFEDFAGLLKNAEFDQKFRENQQKFREAFSTRFALPKQFNAKLRPYQQEGYEWLCRSAAAGVGACLADDMGLGKTVQGLAFLTQRSKLGPALVVAPASVCRNWLQETQRFAPALNPILFGLGERASTVEKAKKGDLVIVTYDLMARESDIFGKKEWATIILDEAQSIKNRNTKRSETAMALKGDFKMMMTGTPLENHLGELWNLFQFANPGLLGSLESFNERFALPIEKYGDENRRDQLRRLVQPFILRRRKDEVLKDLPAKTEITLNVELSPEERAFYEALRREALEKLSGDGNKDMGAGEKHLRILAEIMRLRRAACHPKLVDDNAGFNDSSKLRLFDSIVDELLENGHKALVFSQFVTHLALLEAQLKKKKIKYQYLDGQTPLPTRQKRIEAFQQGEGDFFLISLKAGGVGLNLTAADYVIHMDPWWNPAVEDQATDRAHRIGQTKPVTVYRLVAEGTIEEKILKLHEQKRDLADSLLAGADVSAKLSADELLQLIASR